MRRARCRQPGAAAAAVAGARRRRRALRARPTAAAGAPPGAPGAPEGSAVLVTGGLGFVGSALCLALRRRGTPVVCLDAATEAPTPARWKRATERVLRGAGVVCVHGDAADAALVQGVIAEHGVRRVAHLAASSGLAAARADVAAAVRDNVAATAVVADAAGRARCDALVVASSGSVYGDGAAGNGDGGSAAFAERDAQAAVPAPSAYSASKRSAEAFAASMAALHGTPTTAARLFTVYGERGRPDQAVPRFLAALLAGGAVTLYGDGTSYRDYLYVEDAASALVRALDSPGEGYRALNVAGGRRVTLAELVQACCDACGVDAAAAVRREPAREGDIAGSAADVSAARAALAWEPRVELADGLKRTVAWLRSEDAEPYDFS